MFKETGVILGIILLTGTCCFVNAQTVGGLRWDWLGANDAEILRNKANPGVNDASKVGSPTVTNGFAALMTNGPAEDILSLGILTNIYGATKASWTFEDVTFHSAGGAILFGSAYNFSAGGGYGTLNSWGYLQITVNATPANSSAYIRLWGTSSSGSAVDASMINYVSFSSQTIATNVAYDLQFFFEGYRARVGFRKRDGASTIWPAITWLACPAVILSTNATAKTYATYMGKYVPASGTYAPFIAGAVTVDLRPLQKGTIFNFR